MTDQTRERVALALAVLAAVALCVAAAVRLHNYDRDQWGPQNNPSSEQDNNR